MHNIQELKEIIKTLKLTVWFNDICKTNPKDRPNVKALLESIKTKYNQQFPLKTRWKPRHYAILEKKVRENPYLSRSILQQISAHQELPRSNTSSLKYHSDKRTNQKNDGEFSKISEAYNKLKAAIESHEFHQLIRPSAFDTCKASEGKLDYFELLIHQGKFDEFRTQLPEELINCRNESGKTLLMLAAEHGRFAFAKHLLLEGASIHTRDISGETALIYAAKHVTSCGDKTIYQFLIDYCEANPRDTRDYKGVSAYDIVQNKGQNTSNRLQDSRALTVNQRAGQPNNNNALSHFSFSQSSENGMANINNEVLLPVALCLVFTTTSLDLFKDNKIDALACRVHGHKNSFDINRSKKLMPSTEFGLKHVCGNIIGKNEKIRSFKTGWLTREEPVDQFEDGFHEKQYAFIDSIDAFDGQIIGGEPTECITAPSHYYGKGSIVVLPFADTEIFKINNPNYEGTIAGYNPQETSLSNAVKKALEQNQYLSIDYMNNEINNSDRLFIYFKKYWHHKFGENLPYCESSLFEIKTMIDMLAFSANSRDDKAPTDFRTFLAENPLKTAPLPDFLGKSPQKPVLKPADSTANSRSSGTAGTFYDGTAAPATRYTIELLSVKEANFIFTGVSDELESFYNNAVTKLNAESNEAYQHWKNDLKKWMLLYFDALKDLKLNKESCAQVRQYRRRISQAIFLNYYPASISKLDKLVSPPEFTEGETSSLSVIPVLHELYWKISKEKKEKHEKMFINLQTQQKKFFEDENFVRFIIAQLDSKESHDLLTASNDAEKNVTLTIEPAALSSLSSSIQEPSKDNNTLEVSGSLKPNGLKVSIAKVNIFPADFQKKEEIIKAMNMLLANKSQTNIENAFNMFSDNLEMLEKINLQYRDSRMILKRDEKAWDYEAEFLYFRKHGKIDNYTIATDECDEYSPSDDDILMYYFGEKTSDKICYASIQKFFCRIKAADVQTLTNTPYKQLVQQCLSEVRLHIDKPTTITVNASGDCATLDILFHDLCTHFFEKTDFFSRLHVTGKNSSQYRAILNVIYMLAFAFFLKVPPDSVSILYTNATKLDACNHDAREVLAGEKFTQSTKPNNALITGYSVEEKLGYFR